MKRRRTKKNVQIKKTKRVLKKKKIKQIQKIPTQSKNKEVSVPITPKYEIKKDISQQIGDIEENYRLNIDRAIIDIKIHKTERGLVYSVFIPEIDSGTEALLDDIRKDLITDTTISVGETADKKTVAKIKNKFMSDAHKILKEKVPEIAPETQDFLIGMLMQEMLGLGKIELLINDPNLEEIVIVNSKEPVRVYHKKYGWIMTNIIPKSEDEIINYSNIIARRIGRQINVLTPLLDAHVVTGDRANAVLYPIATKGNTITIRKFARDPFTMADLIENKTVSMEIAALLWLAIEYEMNVLISGGTASGKTVFLNSCMPFIPPNHRIISMEDTRELMLPEFLYWCPLVTRTANPEGKGEVSMLNLLVNSLRMRPDRIVLGEIRRQQEAEVLFEAMHTGHSVYATVHADTANETIRRLTNPPINVPPNMLTSVNLNVIMFRDRKRGIRRVFQVAEFMPGKEKITANILHRWVPETDQFVPHNQSLALFDELGRHTGMSEREIKEDMQKKIKIFEWILRNNLRDLKSIGIIMNLYYTDRERLYSIIKTNNVNEIKQPIKKQSEIKTYQTQETLKENFEEEKPRLKQVFRFKQKSRQVHSEKPKPISPTKPIKKPEKKEAVFPEIKSKSSIPVEFKKQIPPKKEFKPLPKPAKVFRPREQQRIIPQKKPTRVEVNEISKMREEIKKMEDELRQDYSNKLGKNLKKKGGF